MGLLGKKYGRLFNSPAMQQYNGAQVTKAMKKLEREVSLISHIRLIHIFDLFPNHWRFSLDAPMHHDIGSSKTSGRHVSSVFWHKNGLMGGSNCT